MNNFYYPDGFRPHTGRRINLKHFTATSMIPVDNGLNLYVIEMNLRDELPEKGERVVIDGTVRIIDHLQEVPNNKHLFKKLVGILIKR